MNVIEKRGGNMTEDKIRSNAEWIRELRNAAVPEMQRAAHEDLARYLRTVAYNYFRERQSNLPALAALSRQELTAHSEDAVQTLLMRLVERNYALLNKYSFRGAFTSWIAQVLIFQIIDSLRSADYRKRDSTVDLSVCAPTNQMTPEREVMREWIMETLRACIGRLPERNRQILVACCLDGRSAGDVAKEFGLSPNAVYIRNNRARKELAAYLTEAGLGASALAYLAR